MMRRYGLEIAIAILSVCLLVGALLSLQDRRTVHVTVAADGSVTAAVPTGGETETVLATERDGTLWLFLPGTCEGAPVEVNDVHSGEIHNDQTLALGNAQNTTIRILTGSAQPAIFLTTSHDISYIEEDEDKEIADAGDALILSADGGLLYNGELEDIHGRGNASWDQDKKGYNIELAGEVEIPELSYVGEEYALVAHSDTSYVRNRISQEITRAAGGRALDYVTVDLYINGEYRGLYELHEKVSADTLGITDLARQNKDRNPGQDPVQADTGETIEDWNHSVTGKWWNYTNEPADVTGGYILEANDAARYAERRSGFITLLGSYFTIKSPARLSTAEYGYITSYAQ